MVNDFGVEAEKSRNLPNSPDKSNFEQKAYALIDKFGLRDGILHVDQVIARAQEFTQQHQIPETFTDDETNLGLILGCSQKLIESTDLLYKRRVDNFARRLISPSVPQGILDEEELWGSSSDSGGMDDNKLKEYILSITDPEATAQFVEKYAEEIGRCKAVWQNKGYDLDVQVYIVAENSPGQFQRLARAQGYIQPPKREKLSDPNYKPVVELVLLKGHSAEKTELIKHELYHIEDFFDNQRRGYQHGIFELLDELHTEYAVGNYTAEHSRDPFNSGYYTAKDFWNKLSFISGLDFNLITNRKVTIDTIIQQFGFAGLVDFGLMYAHHGGKMRTFETFYATPERAVLAMMIDRAQLNLLREQKSGKSNIDTNQMQQDLTTLIDYLTPTGGEWSPRYRSLYDLVPSQYGGFYAARPVEDGWYGKQVDNERAKQIISSYTQALAIAELSSKGLPIISQDTYTTIRGALIKVPFHREDMDYTPEGEIARLKESFFSPEQDENEFMRERIRSLFIRLVSEVEPVALSFNLNNPDIKQSMQTQFFTQLDQLVEFVLQDADYTETFVKGIYGFNFPFEIREMAVDYLLAKYPGLQPILEKTKQAFNSKRLTNLG